MDTNFHIPSHLTQKINSQQAYHYQVVPVDLREDTLILKAKNTSPSLQQELSIVLGQPVILQEDSLENIQQYLATNFRKTTEQSQDFHYSTDFLEKLLFTAKDIGSSDIHFEPYEEHCRIRFRLDGKLKTYYTITREEYPVIVNKLKIKAGLDISEKRLPQDGRITLKSSQEEFDIRVSSLPTLHGEKIVLRILTKDTSHLSLQDLGFTRRELSVYKESIRQPNGIILISGPTGSGKTTTLYATLKLLNQDATNILTIEDPIEYTLEGVNQVQLKENIGLDFANALRTFLRQDPDIIMVGEIRDVKTAEMAIRAALTGHLVLSTIHTNSAWATISRLIDMGIPPFLIASTLNVSLAQRLVRKLCIHCKQAQVAAKKDFPENFEVQPTIEHHYVAVGCPECYYTGYQGRKAIYEIIPIEKKIIPFIRENHLDIDDYLASENIFTLKQNAIQLIREGVTSIEEVYPLLTH